MEQERRIKIYEIPFHKLTWAILPMGIWQRITGNNLPGDAKILDVWAERGSGIFRFVIQSDSFEKIAIGVQPPIEVLTIALMELRPEDIEATHDYYKEQEEAKAQQAEAEATAQDEAEAEAAWEAEQAAREEHEHYEEPPPEGH